MDSTRHADSQLPFDEQSEVRRITVITGVARWKACATDAHRIRCALAELTVEDAEKRLVLDWT